MKPVHQSTILSPHLDASVAFGDFAIREWTWENNQLVDHTAESQQPHPSGFQIVLESGSSMTVNKSNQQVGELMILDGHQQSVFTLLDTDDRVVGYPICPSLCLGHVALRSVRTGANCHR